MHVRAPRRREKNKKRRIIKRRENNPQTSRMRACSAVLRPIPHFQFSPRPKDARTPQACYKHTHKTANPAQIIPRSSNWGRGEPGVDAKSNAKKGGARAGAGVTPKTATAFASADDAGWNAEQAESASGLSATACGRGRRADEGCEATPSPGSRPAQPEGGGRGAEGWGRR